MRILLLNWRDIRHPKFGGAEVVTMEHAKGWVAAGHDVTWLTASYFGAKREEIFRSVRFIRRSGSLTIYLYVPFFLLTHRNAFDVIVDEVHGFPFFSPLITGKPVVVFIHEIAGEIWDYMFSFPKNIVGKFLERWYFRLYRHCLFWTDAPSTVDELVSRGIPRSQCVAIPCPITPQGKIVAAKAKEKYPTYLFVSRVVRMKGIEEVIKSFSFIVREQQDAVLWIVGSGEESYVSELKAMILEYGINDNVTFWGNVSERVKYDLMARAHVLLHASVKEGWGLVVLEAASVETPSVVYNVPGLKDVVVNHKTGIVIENNSPRDMAKEAMMLLKDPTKYAMYQKNGRRRVAQMKWKDSISLSLTILEKATGKLHAALPL